MIAHVAEITGIAYRLRDFNIGTDGHQEVPHLHMHVLVANPLAECCPAADSAESRREYASIN